MVQRERVAENVYSFQSEGYAQVTAGAVIGPNWAVVIDTLALPDNLLGRAAVVYVRVSFEESLRKNSLRFNPQRPDSILEHALPDETLEIRDFIEQELQVPVRYVINTHYHADHTWGNGFFPGVTVIAHTLCREWMDTRGRQSLEAARRQSIAYRQVRLVLPAAIASRCSADGDVLPRSQ